MKCLIGLFMSFVLVTTMSAQVPPSLNEVFLHVNPTSGKLIGEVASPKTLLSLHQCQAQDQPLFCRLESKWDKRSGHNLRFRLGDQRTVDRLEGKARSSEAYLPHR